VPLGDGDEKDNPDKMCVDVVPASNGAGAPPAAKNALAYPREQWPQLLPRCMDLITAEEVIRRIELYFAGGVIKYLSPVEAEVCKGIWTSS
jgi:hypothetical protein